MPRGSRPGRRRTSHRTPWCPATGCARSWAPGEDDVTASADAFALLEDVVRLRVGRRLTTVVDTLGLDADRRTAWLALARQHGLPCVAVAFDTPAAECRARNRARAKRIPADVLAGQLRAWPAVRDRLPAEGFDEVLAPVPVRVVAAPFAGAAAAVRRQARGPGRAAVRPAPGRVRRARRGAGDPRVAAQHGGRRRGRGLRRDLRHGPLPADPAGRPAVRRHAGELDHAGLPRGLHRAGPARHPGQRHHLPQRRAPGEDRRDPGRAQRRARGVRRRAGLVRRGAPGLRLGLPGDRATATRCSRTRCRCCRCCGGRAARRSAAGCSTCRRPSATRGRCRSTCRWWSGGGGERRTLRLAARYADAANVMGGLDVVRRKAAVLRHALPGRGPGPGVGRACRTCRRCWSAGTTRRWPSWSSRAGHVDAARRAMRRRSTPAPSPTRSAGCGSSPRPASVRWWSGCRTSPTRRRWSGSGEVIAAFR